MVLLIPIVTVVAVFTFVAVVSWAENRRSERESLHKHETYRKMIERSDQGVEQILNLMRAEEIREARKRRDGLILGGLITGVTGIGCMVFFWMLIQHKPVYMIGLIPLLIGIVLTAYGFFMAPRPSSSGSSREPGSVER